MLRDLPEGSRYAAAIMAARDVEGGDEEHEVETDPLITARRDHRTWNLDRQLIAQLINSLNLLIRITGHWPAGKEPEFPPVGPLSWSNNDPQAGGEPTLEQILAAFGG